MVFMSGFNRVKKEGAMLSAKIENPNGDSLFIENSSRREILATFRLDNGILLKEAVNLPMGYYRINDGKEYAMCFLKPDYDLHITVNAKEFDETLKYTGIGSNENNYLAKKYLLEETFKDFKSYTSLDEEEFLNYVNSTYNLSLDLFNNNKQNFDKDFLKLEFEYLKIGYLSKISGYEFYHGHITNNKDFVVSDNFPNPFKDINLDDEQLVLIPGYIYFVIDYLRKSSLEIMKTDTTLTFYERFVSLLDSELKNKKIKEHAAYLFWDSSYEYFPNKEFFFNKLKQMISNPEFLKTMEDNYLKSIQLNKGTISPIFELYDIEDKLVSLKDFRGKIVYIDIWATWCTPCVREIPFLEKLQSEYKDRNIVFVSICIMEDREKWKAEVRERNLHGIQLSIPSLDSKFLTDYLVKGIPRFILIDENGNIIDYSALRPSEQSLKVQLDKLL